MNTIIRMIQDEAVESVKTENRKSTGTPPGTIPPAGDEGVAYSGSDIGWMGDNVVDPDS